MCRAVFVFFAVFASVYAHRYGADIQACDSLVPGHSGTRRQETNSPYRLETNIPGYVPCNTAPVPGQAQQCGLIVRIRSVQGGVNSQFKGFLVQARARINGQMMNVGEFRYLNEQPIRAGTNQQMLNTLQRQNQLLANQMRANTMPRALGQIGINRLDPRLNQVNQFNQMNQNVGNVVVQRLNCPRGFTVTHTENGPKNAVMMKWYPPAGFQGPVQFVGTVVRDFNTYWTGHRSLLLNARPNLQRTAAQVAGQWYSGASRLTSDGAMLVLLTSSISLLMFIL